MKYFMLGHRAVEAIDVFDKPKNDAYLKRALLGNEREYEAAVHGD